MALHENFLDGIIWKKEEERENQLIREEKKNK